MNYWNENKRKVMMPEKHDIIDEFRCLLEASIARVSDRKLLLFCAACCRRFWDKMDVCCRRLVELLEKYSDNEVSQQDLINAMIEVNPATSSLNRACRWAVAITNDWPCTRTEGWSRHLEFCITELVQRQTWNLIAKPSPPTWNYLDFELSRGELDENAKLFISVAKDELHHQMLLAQDIFGHLSQRTTSHLLFPYRIQPDMITEIATSIYKNRQLSDLPILADALEEVGCIDSTILSHFRSMYEHGLGCWALDLLLDKC